jgi:thymidylate synthase
MKGQTDNRILKTKNVSVWNGNTTEEFLKKRKLNYAEDIAGPIYGFQWRHFGAEYVDCHTDYTGNDT